MIAACLDLGLGSPTVTDSATQSGDRRQLLAIMFTDVVGYTALTEREEAVAVRVREQHRELLGTLVKQFDGELVDATGDESLSVFPSALRAVDCALSLQGALQSHADLRLRIGIHLGDVLRHKGEVVGEGVNVAARVRPLAEPGGIVVSEPVYQMIRSRPNVTARALGPQDFKNVAQPVSVYALSTATGAVPSGSGRRRRPVLLGLAAALLTCVALVVWNSAALLTWLALNGPRFLSTPVEQEIGFAKTTDGVRIAYATSGEGPPIVMVLGWITHLTEGIGSPLYDQGGLISSLSRDHVLVRYDGRGFGLSDRDVDDYSLEARVRDLEAVVDALGLERFALFGTSAGGPTAVAYAARHPERVASLVLAATFPGRDPASLDEDRAMTESLIQLFETSWDTPAGRASMVELLAPEANDVQRRVLMHFLLVSSTGASVAGFLRGGFFDVVAEAETLRVPTLVLAGGSDTLVPVERSRKLASLIPGARFEVLDGATHVGASGADSRVVRSILDFVESD